MPMLLQRQTRGVAFGNACGDDGGNDYDYGLVCVVDDSVATSTTTAPPDAASSIASPPRDLEPPLGINAPLLLLWRLPKLQAFPSMMGPGQLARPSIMRRLSTTMMAIGSANCWRATIGGRCRHRPLVAVPRAVAPLALVAVPRAAPLAPSSPWLQCP